jgi:protein SCO1/2
LVKRADLDNQFLVVSFIFTGCALDGLHAVDYMAQIQQKLTNHADVRLVSLTIDPGSDTPEALAKFAQRFGADTNKWFFLTGDRKAVYGLIEQSFLGPPSRSLFKTTPGGFADTDCIFLVDKQGVLKEKFHAGKPTVVHQVLQSIQSRRDSGS